MICILMFFSFLGSGTRTEKVVRVERKKERFFCLAAMLAGEVSSCSF
jgi:hypothetical protein